MNAPRVNSIFAERVRQLRKRFGLTQEALAEKIGVSQWTVSSWEVEKAEASFENLNKLSQFFGVSVDWLLGLTKVEKYDIEKAWIWLPVIDQSEAGLPREMIEMKGEFAPVQKWRVPEPSNYFWVRVEDDSMKAAGILKGALALVSLSAEVKDGDIALLEKGDAVLLRRVYFSDKLIVARSESGADQPIEFLDEAVVRIIGRVMLAQNEY